MEMISMPLSEMLYHFIFPFHPESYHKVKMLDSQDNSDLQEGGVSSVEYWLPPGRMRSFFLLILRWENKNIKNNKYT